MNGQTKTDGGAGERGRLGRPAGGCCRGGVKPGSFGGPRIPLAPHTGLTWEAWGTIQHGGTEGQRVGILIEVDSLPCLA